MINIQKNIVLAPYTTLKAGGRAQYFVVITSREELEEALIWAQQKKLAITILGGGSNVLVSGAVRGLVIKNEIKGLRIVQQDKDKALVEGLSGENWSKFVNFTVKHQLYGLENLFLIYGTVGAAPVQNIGAYGVELKDVFHHLVAIDLKNGQEKVFSAADCHFGYRDSIFKRRLKGRYFIYSVTLQLSRRQKLQLGYGSISETLAAKKIKRPTLDDVIKVIQEIRNSKLPNPHLLPNAGSFFKNPELSLSAFKRLQKQYPQIPSFLAGKKVKVPAAWLIEQAGFKGKVYNKVRMYEKQALILINDGGSAKQVLSHAARVQAGVKKKFGLDLEPEVNVI